MKSPRDLDSNAAPSMICLLKRRIGEFKSNHTWGLICKIPMLMTITTMIPVNGSVFALEDTYTVDVHPHHSARVATGC